MNEEHPADEVILVIEDIRIIDLPVAGVSRHGGTCKAEGDPCYPGFRLSPEHHPAVVVFRESPFTGKEDPRQQQKRSGDDGLQKPLFFPCPQSCAMHAGKGGGAEDGRNGHEGRDNPSIPVMALQVAPWSAGLAIRKSLLDRSLGFPGNTGGLQGHIRELQRIKRENEGLRAQLAGREKENVQEALKTMDVSNTLRDLARWVDRELLRIGISQGERDMLFRIRRRVCCRDLFVHNLTVFQICFNKACPGFLDRISGMFPALTPAELTMACAIAMNLSTDQLAKMLNIMPDSVRKTRFRLKQKLGLAPGESLNGTILRMKSRFQEEGIPPSGRCGDGEVPAPGIMAGGDVRGTTAAEAGPH